MPCGEDHREEHLSHKGREVVAATGALYERVGLHLIIRPTFFVVRTLANDFAAREVLRVTEVGVGIVAGAFHVGACDREDDWA